MATPSLIDPSTAKGVLGTLLVGGVLSVSALLWQGNRDLNRVAGYVRRAEEAHVISRLDRTEERVEDMQARYLELGRVLEALPSKSENDLQVQRFEEGVAGLTDRLQRFESRVDKRFDDLEERIEEDGKP